MANKFVRFMDRMLGMENYEESRAETIMGSAGYPGGDNLYFPTWEVGHAQWPTQSYAAYNQSGYTSSALIFRCVQYTSQGMGSAQLKVYQSAESIDRSSELPDHPFRRLMRHPNLGQSEQTFLTFVGMLLCVTGFAVIEKERNLLGEVIGLWPLRSDWLKPIPVKNNLPNWEYTIPGKKPKVLKSEDVIPITYADTIDNSPTGIGPLEASLRHMGIADALTTFIKAFMDRGAMPMYVAIPSDDPLIQAQWNDQAKVDAWRNGFRDRFGGLNKSLDVAISPGIKEVKALGYDIDQMAFPDLFALNDNAICQAFGISPIVLNTTSGLEQSSYNNYSSARRSFYEDTMFPLWGRIDDAFTRHLLSEMDSIDTFSLAFDTSAIPALKDDVTAAWERATDAFNVGRITMNQGLKHSGMDTVPHGDIYFIPDGVTPIEATDLQTGAVQSAEAQGDIEAAVTIAEKTGDPPSKEVINRGPDSRAVFTTAIDENGQEWHWNEDTAEWELGEYHSEDDQI